MVTRSKGQLRGRFCMMLTNLQKLRSDIKLLEENIRQDEICYKMMIDLGTYEVIDWGELKE